MIKVIICSDSDHTIRGVTLTGHAGYDVYGKDIICASVSALALNMANSVEYFTEDDFLADVGEESGSFTFHFKGEVSRESKLLMDSFILGLKNIEDTYGAKYIKISNKEV